MKEGISLQIMFSEGPRRRCFPLEPFDSPTGYFRDPASRDSE